MAVIQSGATTDQLTVDATSLAARVTMYNTSGTELGKAEGAIGAATPANAIALGLDDGTNTQMAAGASAANLTGNQTLGPQFQVTAIAATWNTTHFPGTATQATISKALNASGRHVATAFTVSLAVAGTTSTALLRWTLRDGATGAGTVLWQGAMDQGSTFKTTHIEQSGLALIGSTNTAMTIEFTGAGTTASQETVSMQGFDTV